MDKGWLCIQWEEAQMIIQWLVVVYLSIYLIRELLTKGFLDIFRALLR